MEELEGKKKKNRRSSLFEITAPDSVQPNKTQPLEVSTYEKQLFQEKRDWTKLVNAQNRKIESTKGYSTQLNKSILSPKQIEFLNEAVDFDAFVKRSLAFNREARQLLFKVDQLNDNLKALHSEQSELSELLMVEFNKNDLNS